jgi:cell division septal protein FtsQ
MAQLERAFEDEAALERHRRRELRRKAAERARDRRQARVQHSQKLRFLMLMTAIVLTVVGVTVAMFETLAWLMG